MQTASEQAAKLLEWFGPNGERWRRGPETDGGCLCLLQASWELFGSGGKATAEARRILDLGGSNTLPDWNDSHTWPDVKRLLESIRDGVPYVENPDAQ